MDSRIFFPVYLHNFRPGMIFNIKCIQVVILYVHCLCTLFLMIFPFCVLFGIQGDYFLLALCTLCGLWKYSIRTIFWPLGAFCHC
jgi:hypothetical protein